MPQRRPSDPGRELPALTPLQNATASATPVIPARRLPVGAIAFLTAIYSAVYLVWEQSHWGNPALRDIIGNVAFMPLNLGVMTLFALASRREGSGSRGAARAAVSGSRGSIGFYRQRNLYRLPGER